MTRTYSNFNTDFSQIQLSRLADKTTTPSEYKDAMASLGECLGEIVSAKIPNSASTVYLTCTVEDADYLAKGMLPILEHHLQSVSFHKKFQFIYLAKDDERTDEGEVVPSIGGMGYERLGFAGQEDKNKYVPELVKIRRRQLVAS